MDKNTLKVTLYIYTYFVISNCLELLTSKSGNTLISIWETTFIQVSRATGLGIAMVFFYSTTAVWWRNIAKFLFQQMHYDLREIHKWNTIYSVTNSFKSKEVCIASFHISESFMEHIHFESLFAIFVSN